jgi:hypothetical protein
VQSINYEALNFVILSILLGEHRLRMLENKDLRRIFGPMKDKVTGNLFIGLTL